MIGVYSAETDERTFIKRPSTSRRRCSCGCGNRSTHTGLAGGAGMMSGCELKVRRWAKRFI